MPTLRWYVHGPSSAAAITSITLSAIPFSPQNKTVTRQKEATWLRFKAAGPVVAADSWRMSKLQAWYSPLDVMLNGSKTLHVVGDGGVAVGSARCWSRAYSEAPSYQAAAGRSRGVKARQVRVAGFC